MLIIRLTCRGVVRRTKTETYLKKNPAASKAVSYAQNGLKLQPRRKKLILTTKPALVNRMIIDCINGRFNMLGYN